MGQSFWLILLQRRSADGGEVTFFSLKHQGSRSSSLTSERNRFPSHYSGCLKSSCAGLKEGDEQGATLGLLTQLLNTISSKLKNPSWLDKSILDEGGLRGSWRHTNNLAVEKQKGSDYTPPSCCLPTTTYEEVVYLPTTFISCFQANSCVV